MKNLTKTLSIIVLVVFSLSLLSLSKPAEAGIGLFEGSVSINALESKTLCNLMVYSTIPSQTPEGTIKYSVSYSSDISTFVSDIQPNNFNLKQIDCPSAGDLRRQCIKDYCLNSQDDYCRVVCTTFTGPFELSFNPQPIRYNGAIRDTASFGSANVMNAQAFIIYYTPYDTKMLILYVVIILVIVGAGIFAIKRRMSKGRKAKGKR